MKRALVVLALLVVPVWAQAQPVVISVGTQGPPGANIPAGGSEGLLPAKTGAGFGWSGAKWNAGLNYTFDLPILSIAADNCAAPPFSFTGQTTSGLCSSAAGTLNLRVGGVNQVSLTASNLVSTVPGVFGSAVTDGTAAMLRSGTSGATATAIRAVQAETSYTGSYASTGIDVIANVSGANSQNHVVGVQSNVTTALDAGRTITNAYAFYGTVTNSGPGALTNAYGLYLPAPGGTVANKYGIWSGGGTNVLTGNTGVGGDPAAGMAFQVRSTGNAVYGVAAGTGGDTSKIGSMQLDAGSTTVGYLYFFGSTYATSGRYIAGSVLVESGLAGGLTLAAMQGNGPVRIWSKGAASVTFNGLIATLEPVVFASLGTPANGSIAYCSDCAPQSNPCTATSTGALAVRLNGAWDCR